jgi:hypothetical protein
MKRITRERPDIERIARPRTIVRTIDQFREFANEILRQAMVVYDALYMWYANRSLGLRGGPTVT